MGGQMIYAPQRPLRVCTCGHRPVEHLNRGARKLGSCCMC